jgi:Fe-S-cluster containining protein
MDVAAAYRQAYARLGRLTPILADCGQLCGKRCCQGGDGDGMILFPGEEPLGSLAVTDADMGGYPVRFAVCPGRCRRENRPLSCRIFPFAPYLDSSGEVTVIADPRAESICPLVSEAALTMIDPRFPRAVQDVFIRLLGIGGMRPMLEAYSKMLDDYKSDLLTFRLPPLQHGMY